MVGGIGVQRVDFLLHHQHAVEFRFHLYMGNLAGFYLLIDITVTIAVQNEMTEKSQSICQKARILLAEANGVAGLFKKITGRVFVHLKSNPGNRMG